MVNVRDVEREEEVAFLVSVSASGSNELSRVATRARTERLEQRTRSCFFPVVSLVLAPT